MIVLSVRVSEREKIQALDSGCNDYVEKPFGVNELLARIRAVLRTFSGIEVPAPLHPLILIGLVELRLLQPLPGLARRYGFRLTPVGQQRLGEAPPQPDFS